MLQNVRERLAIDNANGNWADDARSYDPLGDVSRDPEECKETGNDQNINDYGNSSAQHLSRHNNTFANSLPGSWYARNLASDPDPDPDPDCAIVSVFKSQAPWYRRNKACRKMFLPLGSYNELYLCHVVYMVLGEICHDVLNQPTSYQAKPFRPALASIGVCLHFLH